MTMKEVQKKDLPEVPGGVQSPYPGQTDVGIGGRLFPGLDEYPKEPTTPTPTFGA
jgi:hypothetical protein